MRTNLAIFVLFFGVALLDAVAGGHWLRVAFWVAIGAVFVVADRKGRSARAAARQEISL